MENIRECRGTGEIQENERGNMGNVRRMNEKQEWRGNYVGNIRENIGNLQGNIGNEGKHIGNVRGNRK